MLLGMLRRRAGERREGKSEPEKRWRLKGQCNIKL